MEETRRVSSCYESLWRAMVQKDRSVLESVLDSSSVLEHMTGLRQSRETFIRAVEDGTLCYFGAEQEEIRVAEMWGDQARLVGRTPVSAAVFGGGRSLWRLQLDTLLVRSGETWRFTRAKASTY